MTAYTDVAQANALIEEQARLTSGISMLDNGGTVAFFTVNPAPPPSTGAIPPPVRVETPNASPELLTAARDFMVARCAEITTQLDALSVTDIPATPA